MSYLDYFCRDHLPDGANTYSVDAPYLVLTEEGKVSYRVDGSGCVPLFFIGPEELESKAEQMLMCAADHTSWNSDMSKVQEGVRLHVLAEPEYIGRHAIAPDGRQGLILFGIDNVTWVSKGVKPS